MPPTDVNSQKNAPAFKPPPRIEAGSSREKSTTPSTPYRLVVPFPVGQTSQGTSQGASQSTSASQGASQGVDAMHDIEITSPMYIANVDVRARDEQQLNRARDEPELNRDHEGVIVKVNIIELKVNIIELKVNIIELKVNVIELKVMELKVIVLQQLLTIVR